MYYKFFRWFISLFIALAICLGGFTPALAAPPANDNFADAEVISSIPFTTTVDMTDTGSEPGEPFSCFSPQTVWYSFTPTQTMTIHVDTLGGAVNGLVGIYHATGSGISNLQYLACIGFGSSSPFLAEAGQTYYLQASPNGGTGTIQINLQQVFPPTNDIFANAEVVTSLPFSASPDMTDTTFELNEPNYCGYPQTAWYSFTPAQTMGVRVDTLGGTVNGIVSVYHATGSGISNLQFLTCATSSSSTFLAEGGQTYYLQASPNGGTGIIQINLQQVFPPANDIFANAEVISSLPFTATVDMTDTGVEPGEPYNCFTPQTVWYSFTPAQTMSIRVDTQGGTVPGIVDIFQATGNGLANLQHLACIYGSSSTFLAEAGQTYYLQAGPGPSIGGGGTIQISLQQIFPPANDFFANAEVVSSLPFTATVDMTDSGFEPGEVFPCGFSQLPTVWYSFTPTQTMSIRADIPSSASSSQVNIYHSIGIGLSNLQFLGCAGSGNSSTFLAEAGQTYYLQVGPFLGGSSTVQFNLQQVSPSTMEVGIDIKPGDARNQIEIKRKDHYNYEKISVAILSTAQFNASQQVDKNSLTFGATGDENSLSLKGRKRRPDCQVKDVNKDRLPDLVCSFVINKTGFRLGDTIGILKGMTLTGNPFTGQDLVKIKRSSHEHDDHNHNHHDD